jgi:hypothetical protein
MDHQEKPWEKTKAFVHTHRGWKHQIFPTFSVEFNPSKRFSSPPTAVDCTIRDSLTDVDSPSTNTIVCKGSTFFVPLLRQSLYLHVIRMGQASSVFSQAALSNTECAKAVPEAAYQASSRGAITPMVSLRVSPQELVVQERTIRYHGDRAGVRTHFLK